LDTKIDSKNFFCFRAYYS